MRKVKVTIFWDYGCIIQMGYHRINNCDFSTRLSQLQLNTIIDLKHKNVCNTSILFNRCHFLTWASTVFGWFAYSIMLQYNFEQQDTFYLPVNVYFSVSLIFYSSLCLQIYTYLNRITVRRECENELNLLCNFKTLPERFQFPFKWL